MVISARLREQVANMQSDLKADLTSKYREFFDRYGIDEQTGQLGYDPTRKFATYPYIGSRYGEAAKILIVGLDIGKDETCGRFQSFEDRRAAIEDKELWKHNPHIAGTYFTALFFLKKELGWQNHWNRTKDLSSCQTALKNRGNLPTQNPLSYIALTNHYKFVTAGRKKRRDPRDREYLNRRFDQNFFIEEVKVFEPDIIIFQSIDFFKYRYRRVLDDLSEERWRIYVGPHPVLAEQGGSKDPGSYINRILDGFRPAPE